MLQLSLSTTLPSIKTPGAGAFPALSGDFALALADLTEAMPGAPPMLSATPIVPPVTRQIAAAGGKSLPAIADAVDPTAPDAGSSKAVAATESLAQPVAPLDGKGDAQPNAIPNATPRVDHAAHRGRKAARADRSQAVAPADATGDADSTSQNVAALLSSMQVTAAHAPPSDRLTAIADAPISAKTLPQAEARRPATAKYTLRASASALAVIQPNLAARPLTAPTDAGESTPASVSTATPIASGANKRASSDTPTVSVSKAVTADLAGPQPATPSPTAAPLATRPGILRDGKASSPAVLADVFAAPASSSAGAVAASPARTSSLGEQTAAPDDDPVRATPAATNASVAASAAAVSLPVGTNPLSSQPLPAGIAFGPALAIAFADQRAKNETPPADENPLLGLVATTLQAPAAAIGDASHAALDMRRDDWPQAMIDRIEALRDAADANDTRIRLLPDALGKVDVSLRHDGDAVHVHFAAELPATQTLLNNAQPRLAELAHTRGLRLSQGAVDSGAADTGGQRRDSLPGAQRSTRPASAATNVVDAGADSRLA